MKDIIPIIICGIYFILMFGILVVFTLESREADKRYAEAMRRIRNGEYV